MSITIAENSGFCFGVGQALEKAEKLLQEKGGGERPIHTCGLLIHNKSVTDELERRGLTAISGPEEAKEGAIVIVRAHGEPKEFYEKAEERGLQIIDATCPFVKRIQKLAYDAHEKGRQVVIVGDPTHPEVIGINGWTGNTACVVSSAEEARFIYRDSITVVAQTTIISTVFEDVISTLQASKNDVEIYNTICSATEERQKSCADLAAKSDLMIIIGGKNSSNSKKLYEISKKNCENSFFVEILSDLPLKEVAKCNKIGIAAGASTPERIIKEVIAAMSEANTENKDLQEQVEEVNGMEALMEEIEKSLRLPGRGEIVTGEIIQVSKDYIVVNLGCKKDGIIPREELSLEGDEVLSELFKTGDEIQAKVIKTADGDGSILLSKKKLQVNEHWDEINAALDNKEIVNAKVVKEVKGGVIAVYKEVSGFIPMSQLSDHYVEKADEFIGKILPVKVSRVDQKRNKAVFSHKAYLNEEKQKKIAEIWDNLHVGDVVEGTVMRFTDYGAFVDIGGLDGLLHISEISWGKLKHPQEALEIGQKISVKILSMNTEKGKISLGLKQNTPEPWSVIDDKYQIGQVIKGKVVQIKDYGAFVELEPGLDGLVHISEVAYKRVTNIADEISVGQEVDAKILEIDRDRKRISLSIKETLDDSVYAEDDAAGYDDQAYDEGDSYDDGDAYDETDAYEEAQTEPEAEVESEAEEAVESEAEEAVEAETEEAVEAETVDAAAEE